MMVRSRDDIYRMKDLKGKKIGLSKSLNTDQERLVAHPGGTGHRADAPHERDDPKDVEIVEFPYPDDWYNKPENAGSPWTMPPNCGSNVTTSMT